MGKKKNKKPQSGGSGQVQTQPPGSGPSVTAPEPTAAGPSGIGVPQTPGGQGVSTVPQPAPSPGGIGTPVSPHSQTTSTAPPGFLPLGAGRGIQDEDVQRSAGRGRGIETREAGGRGQRGRGDGGRGGGGPGGGGPWQGGRGDGGPGGGGPGGGGPWQGGRGDGGPGGGGPGGGGPGGGGPWQGGRGDGGPGDGGRGGGGPGGGGPWQGGRGYGGRGGGGPGGGGPWQGGRGDGGRGGGGPGGGGPWQGGRGDGGRGGGGPGGGGPWQGGRGDGGRGGGGPGGGGPWQGGRGDGGRGGRGRGEGGRGGRGRGDGGPHGRGGGGRGDGGRGEISGVGMGQEEAITPPKVPEVHQKSPTPTPLESVTKEVEKMSVSQQKQDTAATALEKLGAKHVDRGFRPPVRKSVGTNTMCNFTVETNHLPLKIRLKEVIHYDVAIEPDKPKKFMRYVMSLVQKKCYPNRLPAFDGRKNLYSSGPMDFGREMSTEVVYHDSERNMDMTYKVTIKFAAQIDMTCLETYMMPGSSAVIPQRQLQAIDVVLRSAPSLRFTPVGRSFFTPPSGRVHDLTGGMELWYGFYQSAILGWKPYVNVDVAHKGFPKAQHCMDLIRELCPKAEYNRTFSSYDEETLSKYLKGLKVNYEIPGVANSKRTYKVNGLKPPANVHRFKLDGKEMTVEQYYRDFKNYALKCPNFQLLHLGPPQKEMFMPIELCSVFPGQVVMRKLNEAQTTNMIRQAATPADVRKSKILDAIKKCSFERDQTLKEFGISVGQNFEQVEARILPAPRLTYGAQAAIDPMRGVWNVRPFYQGTELMNWAIVVLDNYVREDQLQEFIRQINQSSRNLGMKVSPPITKRVDTRKQRPDTWLDFQNQKFQIIVVVVSDFGKQYAKVKQMAELQLGVLTQCVRGQTVQRLKPATTSNILLKINSKLNGVNHILRTSLPCLSRPVMIVGADVTHPSPDAKDQPSAAAVAASIDANAFKYAIQYRIQPARLEVIEDLTNIMKKLLLTFYKNNHKIKPEKIIIFRDGVSDGQFSIVLNNELTAIRKACSELQQDYQPPITFLVVQKRHHTRFFPTNLPHNFVDQRNKNVPAGTIVDTKITHPTELDFYLVSHASIQGTSRPTKYHLLWDDNNLSTDEIEALTYYLCHMFSRCTRSVSYPAPTYYAHLAAFRARVYMEDGYLSNPRLEERIRNVQNEFADRCPMFFV